MLFNGTTTLGITPFSIIINNPTLSITTLSIIAEHFWTWCRLCCVSRDKHAEARYAECRVLNVKLNVMVLVKTIPTFACSAITVATIRIFVRISNKSIIRAGAVEDDQLSVL
jgi:hypothetical protein